MFLFDVFSELVRLCVCVSVDALMLCHVHGFDNNFGICLNTLSIPGTSLPMKL